MKNQIFEKIVDYYRNCSTNGYGEITGVICIYEIIGNESQLSELQSLVQVSTYGGRFGTYKAFNPWGAFKCDKLKQMCNEAFKQNKNRSYNLNNW